MSDVVTRVGNGNPERGGHERAPILGEYGNILGKYGNRLRA
jgi:hypothetical protein